MKGKIGALLISALLTAAGGTAARAQAPTEAAAPLRVTLDEAIARATAGNALLQASREEVRAREGQAKEARSYAFPSLTLVENYSRTNNPVYVFMGKLTQANFQMSDFYLPNLNNPEPLTNFQSRVELTMPLFAGGKIRAARRAAGLGVETARDSSAFAESSVRKGVTEAFYGSLLAAKAVAVYGETVKTAEAHLTQVEAMHKEGLVLDSDLLRMRVFVSDMKQQKAAREADAQVARAYLAYAMGTTEDVQPEGELAPPAAALPELAEAQKEALGARGDIKAIAAQTKRAAEGVTISRADYMPQVGLMASYEQDTERWSPGAWGDNWMLGIQLRLPLFDAGARAGRLQSARAQETMAEKALLDLEQRALVEVKSAWLRAKAAAQRIDVTAGSEDQASENQRIVSLRYQEGLAALTDLLDADTALTAAALSRSQAAHDELVERAHLAWAMGK